MLVIKGICRIIVLVILVQVFQTTPSYAESSVKITQIAASPTHVLILTNSGEVYGWGRNGNGQLGDGTLNNQTTSLTRVKNLPSIAAISVGFNTSYALTEQGDLYTWGFESYGELGDGQEYSLHMVPIKIEGLPQIKQIDGGSSFTVALTNSGDVYTFGNNSLGQLGDGTTVNSLAPLKISGLSNVSAISSDYNDAMALTASGEVYSWGNNSSGQLGDNSKISRSIPVKVSGLPVIKAFSAGLYHSLALAENGAVYGWGSNQHGQLGLESDEDQLTPILISSFPNTQSVIAGSNISYIHSDLNEVYSLGKNEPGESPLNDTPKKIDGLSDVQMLVNGGVFMLCLTASGDIMGWGSNDDGMLLQGFSAYKSTPVQLSAIPEARDVSAGYDFNTMVTATGEVYAWGKNNQGQLGDGTNEDRDFPTLIAGLPPMKKISADVAYVQGISVAGTVYGWGSNYYGVIGDGTNINRISPVVVSGISNAVDIASAYSFTAALNNEGDVYNWGQGFQRSPVKMNGLPVMSAIAAGEEFAIALSVTGEVYGWGHLPGTAAVNLTPVKIEGLNAIKGISAGLHTAYAVTATGSAYAWGYNTSGQLGDGTKTDSFSPKLIPGLSDIEFVAAGWEYAHAVTHSGNVYGWGVNTNGQYGDGTEITHLTVGIIPFSEKITAISSRYAHSIARTESGHVYTWGVNYNGEIGDGSGAIMDPTNLTPKVVAGIAAVQALPDVEAPYWSSNSVMTTSEIGANDATVNWSAAGDHKAVTAYKIYQVSGQTYTELAESNSTATTYRLNKLNANSIYKVTVKAKDASGNWSGYGPLVIFQTNNSDSGGTDGIVIGGPGAIDGVPLGGAPIGLPSTESADKEILPTADSPVKVSTEIMNDGQTIKKVTVSETHPDKAFTLPAQGTAMELTVEGHNAVTSVNIPIGAIRTAAYESKRTVIRIITSEASYDLPVSLLNELPQDGIVEVRIQVVNGKGKDNVDTILDKEGVMQLIANPIDFSVYVNNEQLTDFKGAYVGRTIVADTIMNTDWTTAVWIDGNNQMHFIPSRIANINNSSQITIYSPHNSVYTVIQSHRTFKDIQGHWAKADIEVLANKRIINGVTENSFAPEQLINRAEFATLLVRDLGLKEVPSVSSFQDMNEKMWFAGAVETAYSSKLIQGYDDGTLRPNDPITREQLAVMMQRALKFVGKDIQATNSVLDRFIDESEVAEWGKAAAAELVTVDILQGTTEKTLGSKEFVTRAQGAVFLKRMLQYMEFINY